MTQEILKLQSDINHTFAKQLHGLSGDGLLKGIADGLGMLNSFTQLKMASSSNVYMIVYLFFLFFHSLEKTF